VAFPIIRRWHRSAPWYHFLPFWHVKFQLFFLNKSIRFTLLHQIYWFQHNSLWKFKFSTLLYKLNLWIYIFNMMLFFLKVLLQTIGAPLCFTILHFTKNNRCYLKRSVACRPIFCPQMSLFYLRNSSRCFKPLIYLICIQIITNGNAIFHLFM
jgi:hypothetical protein